MHTNGIKLYQFKLKDSAIKSYSLCLGNVSKDFTVEYMNQIGLSGYLYDFSVHYNIIDVTDIVNIHLDSFISEKFTLNW